MNKNKKGFTLIEVMIVIAIIGFISSLIIAQLTATRAKARDTQRIAEMKNIEKALNLYSLSNNGAVYVTSYSSWTTLKSTYNSSTICAARSGLTNTLFSVLKSSKTLSSIPNPDPMASKGYCYLYITDTTGRYAVLATALEGMKNNDGSQSVAGITFGNASIDWVNINLTTGVKSLITSPF